jgi:hypothetical protein
MGRQRASGGMARGGAAVVGGIETHVGLRLTRNARVGEVRSPPPRRGG